MASFQFYRCPNTGKVIRALNREKEVSCDCGRSNPAAVNAMSRANWLTRFLLRTERTEETGTHLRRYLERATGDEILASLPASLRSSKIAQDLFK
jgi:hypothetical protein